MTTEADLRARIAELEARLKDAEAERDAAVDAIDPTLKNMRLENGQLDMAIAGPAVERLALLITEWFRASGARNYVEMSLFARDNSMERYIWSVQKSGAMSPHDKVKAAEAALAEAARVLLPFAAAAQRFDEAAEHFKADRPADDSKPRTDFTLGQLRAARAFIDEHGVTFTDDGKAVCVRIGE